MTDKPTYNGLGPKEMGTYDVAYDTGTVVRITAETKRQVELLQSHWENNCHVTSIKKVKD